MTPLPSTPERGRGEAVREGFTLPWNTTKTMGDVFRMRDERSAKGGKATAAKKRAQFVREVQGKRSVTPDGKIPYAGYDASEFEVKRATR